jgi:hypothetical protein
MPAAAKFHLVAENRRPMGGHRKGESATVLQGMWRTCCQSSDEHRFDCEVTPPEKRGAGPCLPRRPMTPAELIHRMRKPRRLAVDEPRPGTMRVRATGGTP